MPTTRINDPATDVRAVESFLRLAFANAASIHDSRSARCPFIITLALRGRSEHHYVLGSCANVNEMTGVHATYGFS